jgi:hypothetical protein
MQLSDSGIRAQADEVPSIRIEADRSAYHHHFFGKWLSPTRNQIL